MSNHKPRRKEQSPGGPNTTSRVPKAENGSDFTPFTLAELLASGRRTSTWLLLLILISVAFLFRWSVGLWGYSGQGIEPMHGDFEAQRHWMEITTHLSPARWYFYDLQYWGLDYPPLTAYHSYFLGRLGALFNSSWFALDSSRGFESDGLKLYMRASVIGSELLFYVPAAVKVCRRLAGLNGASGWNSSIALAALLLQPGTILIDHGHFQYNTVMLGLVLGAISSWTEDRYAAGCMLFVGALAFKQMALYYAPAVFAYLLGSCVFPRLNPTRFIIIAISTSLAFAAAWAPLLLEAIYDHYQNPMLSKTLEPPPLFTTLISVLPFSIPNRGPVYIFLVQLTQSIHRIFPFSRGLFEDKVANLWLAIHTVYKLNRFPVESLSRLSLLATLAAIFPSSLIIFLRPKKTLLPLALASCAWSFFLLSFQVHEKSVLLPLLPMTLLLASEPGGLGAETRAWVTWANALGTWTMFPLLKRDGLAVPYAAIMLLWSVIMDIPPLRWELYRIDKDTPRQASFLAIPLHVAFYVITAVWHWAEMFVEPMDRKPDLWVVLNCLIGVIGFVICWIWCNSLLLYRSGLLDKWLKQENTTKGEHSTEDAGKSTQLNTPKKKTENSTVTSKKNKI